MAEPLLAETERLLREAERLAVDKAGGSPDHETARLVIRELRQLNAELTDAKSDARNRVRASLRTIERARELLARLEGGDASN
jgi:hypothetical protein